MILLIDGNNLLIRNYCVSPLMDSHGRRCGGSIGTLKSVRKLLNDFRPDNVLIVWDGEGGSQRRRSIMSEYKAGRKVRLNRKDDFGETPQEDLENLKQQYVDCQDYLTMLGVPQVRCAGVEADDLIAYLAIHSDQDALIVSTDQDLLQLIRAKGQDHYEDCHVVDPLNNGILLDDTHTCECPARSEVKVWSPIKGKMYDRQKFISDYGVLPENYRLMKALVGDNSDNIEGIKGFGLKTIPKSFPFLAERKSTPKDLFDAAAGLKGVLGSRLIEAESKFRENLMLVDLSEPMLSGESARQAREALRKELPVRELDLRVRMTRDGTSVSDADKLVQPFRQLVIRRKRLIS